MTGRSEDNRRCLNGGGEAASRRDDPHCVRSVNIRSSWSTALSGITASQVRHRAGRSHERLPVRRL